MQLIDWRERQALQHICLENVEESASFPVGVGPKNVRNAAG